MAAEQSSQQPASEPAVTVTNAALSPAARKQLHRCFDRGREVLKQQEKPDRDYAHTMFVECVNRDRANLEYVEAMLENLQLKYNNNKKGARLRGFGGRGNLKKAVAASDWDEVFELGFELIKTNPWDVAALRAIAQACQANHYNEVELRYLKNALDANPNDLDVCRHCAESLARMGQFDQAIALWHRVEEKDKSDKNTRRMVSELTLAKQRGGLPGTEEAAKAATLKSVAQMSKPTPQADDSATTAKPEAEAAKSAPEAAGAKPSVSELEAAVASDDAKPEAFIALADAHTAENRYRDAYQTLKQGLDASGGANLSLLEKLEEAQIRMIRSQVAIAEKRAASQKTQEAADLARRFRAELNRQEVQIFSNRCQRYPDDKSLQFELGVRLKRDGNYHAARQAFETARNAADLRAAATLELGECLQHLKQYSNAMKCYKAAADAGQGTSEIHKLSLYRGGVLATALKNLDAAEKMLAELVKLDPEFRDARARLDKARQIGDDH